MEDIAPKLLKDLQQAFRENLAADKTAAALLEKISAGNGAYADALDYAGQIGEALAKAFRENLNGAMLPDGKMYWNIADRAVRPLLAEDHDLAVDASVLVQEALNRAAGIGLKAQRPQLNEDRVEGFLNRLAAAERYEDVYWILQEPVKTFSRSAVDDTLKANAEFQSRVGLRPKIIRRTTGKCCKWCSDLAGTYEYPYNVPADVYRRHEYCRCVVEYDPGSGKRQNVHAKQWTEPGENDKIEARKQIGMEHVRKFQSDDLLKRHFTKHEAEFGGISIPEYLRRASALADAPLSDDVVSLLRSDGSTSKYRYATNEFVVINADGTIRTYYIPKKGKEYWDEEIERNQ